MSRSPLRCSSRAAREPQALLPVDRGTTDAEVAALAEQFDAAAIIAADGTLSIPVHQTRNTSYRDVAVLKLTSGSMGRPRATLTPEAALISDGSTLATAMDIRPDDVQIAADSALAFVRHRQSRDAASASRHGDLFAGSVCPAARSR